MRRDKDLEDFENIEAYVDYLENLVDDEDLDNILEDIEEDDVFDWLDYKGFDFLNEMDSQELIEHLSGVGYKMIPEESDANELDLIDNNRLEEIKNLFIYSSFTEREKIYNKIIYKEPHFLDRDYIKEYFKE